MPQLNREAHRDSDFICRESHFMQIQAVLFDFDGTLTQPGVLDYSKIRKAVGCPEGRPILEYIESISSTSEQDKARRILDRYEVEAARQSFPNIGAEDLLRFLQSHKLKIGIISRNRAHAIQIALENFPQTHASDFDVILSRDDAFLPKPSPEAVIAAAQRLDVPAEQVLMVGDFVFDIQAGKRAGAYTAFITNNSSVPAFPEPPDYIINHLPELKEIVRFHLPLPLGKLPNDLLDQFLKGFAIDDPSILVGPGVGEDIAAIRMAGEEILVLKSDPITFTTDATGYYAVIVNANDVATCGATPRWLLTSLLFPPQTCPIQIQNVMCELFEVSRQQNLVLCGGHTEITDSVNRPVVVAQVAGTVAESCFIDKRNMRAGNHILLTKGIAIEGTCIIAREFPEKLAHHGMPVHEIEKCRQLLVEPGISVLKEASIAAKFKGVTAMHDVTEGGLSKALEELSIAGKHRIRIYHERIPILKETKYLCSLLCIHPLGLIGSGSMLISCVPETTETLLQAIWRAGIEATHIGEALESGEGVEACSDDGEIIQWPHFDVDEITRLY